MKPLGPHAVDLVLEPWAVTPGVLAIVAAVLARRVAGRADDGSWAADRRPPRQATRANAVAVLPIHGLLSPRINMMADISGGTSYDQIAADLRAAVADPHVGTIVLDFDTPGGSTSGIVGLARTILAARASKPIVAQVEHKACSAGYWLAACATEIVASPLSQIGSIGVYAIHENLAEALQKEGVAITLISAGKYKTEGSEIGPLTDEARAHRQALIDEAYNAFVADVARGRGVAESVVRTGYGEGRVLSADMALAAKMIDRVATLDDTLARLTSGDPAAASPALALHADTPQARTGPGQDRRADVAFARDLEASLLGLGF